MPRPTLCRKVSGTPKATYFKPRGVPLDDLDVSYLTVEGLEALRLSDLESLTTTEAAARMGVSRHTFGRILGKARRAVSFALVNALALRIEGGEYAVTQGEEQPLSAQKTIPQMNVVAVSAQGPLLTDMVDSRLGRAAGFVVVDLGTGSSRFVDNGQALAMAHGAGIQAAQMVAEAGAGVLLTGIVGPKAFAALEAAGIKVGLDMQGMTVGEAVEGYRAGKVLFADGPNK